MPVHVDDVTRVYLVKYANVIGHHVTKIRGAATSTNADFQTFWNDFIANTGDIFYATDLLAIDVKEAASHDSFPIDVTGFTATWGTNPADKRGNSRFVSYVGRDGGGVRGRISLYGYRNADSDDSFRLTPSEVSAVDNTLTFLAGAEGFGLTIAGNTPIWANYANWGYSAYWQRKERSL